MLFVLESENLTGLGGPMGSEHTSCNWARYYKTMDKAKLAAKKDYKKECNGKPEEEIKWSKGKNNCSSQDLRFVMYHISSMKVEK
jgi:hypothetical protein